MRAFLIVTGCLTSTVALIVSAFLRSNVELVDSVKLEQAEKAADTGHLSSEADESKDPLLEVSPTMCQEFALHICRAASCKLVAMLSLSTQSIWHCILSHGYYSTNAAQLDCLYRLLCEFALNLCLWACSRMLSLKC